MSPRLDPEVAVELYLEAWGEVIDKGCTCLPGFDHYLDPPEHPAAPPVCVTTMDHDCLCYFGDLLT